MLVRTAPHPKASSRSGDRRPDTPKCPAIALIDQPDIVMLVLHNQLPCEHRSGFLHGINYVDQQLSRSFLFLGIASVGRRAQMGFEPPKL
jgi:hypothetical protein